MCFCGVRERLVLKGRGGDFEVTVTLWPLDFLDWNLVEGREKAVDPLPPCRGPSQDGLYVLGHSCYLRMIINSAPFLKPALVWIWSPNVWITSGSFETFVSRNEHQLPVGFFPSRWWQEWGCLLGLHPSQQERMVLEMVVKSSTRINLKKLQICRAVSTLDPHSGREEGTTWWDWGSLDWKSKTSRLIG